MISQEYQATLREAHRLHKWGNAGSHSAGVIKELCIRFNGKSVLDYGCGRGSLKTKLAEIAPQLSVTEYDPGIIEKDFLPTGVWDVIACCDVLEHVEAEFVNQTLEAIAVRTNRAAHFIIACGHARFVLPDGRNAHLTIQPTDWWMRKLECTFNGFYPEADIRKRRVDVTMVRK